MTEQHECDYGLRICMDPRFSPYLEIDCACGCGRTLSPREARDRLNEYETLKKATEALSAERAGKMADEMETGRRISTSRHIRELRAYVDILGEK